MRKNADQNNSEYGHILHSVFYFTDIWLLIPDTNFFCYSRPPGEKQLLTRYGFMCFTVKL